MNPNNWTSWQWLIAGIIQFLGQVWGWIFFVHSILPEKDSLIFQWWGIPLVVTAVVSIICGIMFCGYMESTIEKRAEKRAEKLKAQEKLMSTLKNGLPR